MNAILSRTAGRVWSVVTTLLLLTVSVCANAQSNVMSKGGGDNQSAYAGEYSLPNPLSVSFSGSSYVTLDLTASNGARLGTNFSSSDSVFYDPSSNPTFSVNVYTPDSAGPFQVTITCSSGCTSVQSFTFNETALQPPPYLQMRKSGGDAQTGPPGTELPTALQVTLTPTTVGYDGPFQETITWTVEDNNATFAESNSSTYSEVISLGSGQPGRPNSKTRAKAVAAAAQSFIGRAHLILGAVPGDVRVRVRCPDCTQGGDADFPGNDRSPHRRQHARQTFRRCSERLCRIASGIAARGQLAERYRSDHHVDRDERTSDAERGIEHDRCERTIADHVPLRQHGWTDLDSGFRGQRRTSDVHRNGDVRRQRVDRQRQQPVRHDRLGTAAVRRTIRFGFAACR